MPVVGSPLPFVLYLADSSGDLTYASKALFLAAGWNLTWYDEDSIALSVQPTWTLPVAGAAGRHQFQFLEPRGPYTIKVTKPAGAYSSPIEGQGEGVDYDINSIGALIATSGGVAISNRITTDSATIYHGDSLDLSFSVLEAALASIGANDLSDCTLYAGIKLTGVDSGDAAAVDTWTALAATSDTIGNRVVRAQLDAFPVALAVPSNSTQLSAVAHLRLTVSTKTLIVAAIALTVEWKATD